MHVEASGLNEHDMFRKWEKLGSTLGVMGRRLGQGVAGFCMACKGLW